MLTGKQRSYLKKLAQSIDPAVYIGKYGLTDAGIESVNENLTANELVKVKIQDGSELQPKDVCQYMAETADAFNDFYLENKILAEPDEEKKAGFISLIRLTGMILDTCMDLLGIESPEHM